MLSHLEIKILKRLTILYIICINIIMYQLIKKLIYNQKERTEKKDLLQHNERQNSFKVSTTKVPFNQIVN